MPKIEPFPLTHWSLVRRAGLSDEVARKQALQALLERYTPALRSYLWVVLKYHDEECQELLQGFIADQVLAKDLFARADQSKGRFRTLVLKCLRNYAFDQYRRKKRMKTCYEEPDSFEDSSPTGEIVVQARWVRTLLNGVIVAMKSDCQRAGRMDIWQVFEERILSPIFAKANPPSYEDLAKRLKLASPHQAANLLVTAKRTYARLLRAAVGEYELEPDAINEEITDLWRILAESPNYSEDTHAMG